MTHYADCSTNSTSPHCLGPLQPLNLAPSGQEMSSEFATQRNYCKLVFKITIVLLSFAGFLYQATDVCAHYFSYRTVVYTNTEQDSLVDLPSITFCLPTYFTKRTLEDLYAPYIKRNVDETAAFKNNSMLEAIKPVIYETFQVCVWLQPYGLFSLSTVLFTLSLLCCRNKRSKTSVLKTS